MGEFLDAVERSLKHLASGSGLIALGYQPVEPLLDLGLSSGDHLATFGDRRLPGGEIVLHSGQERGLLFQGRPGISYGLGSVELSFLVGFEAGEGEQPALKARILAAGNLLGILEQDPTEWLQEADADAISAEAIEALIAEREQAKLDKNYARADEIREQLAAEGVVLEDSREGTRWKRA